MYFYISITYMYTEGCPTIYYTYVYYTMSYYAYYIYI